MRYLLVFLSIILASLPLEQARAFQEPSEPRAVFDDAYRSAHQGSIRYSIPEAYELVNIAIALTTFVDEEPRLVETTTPYFAEVRRHFAGVRDHPFVRMLDREIRADLNSYFSLKMNGYAFVFDETGRLSPSPVYRRTGFADTNVLLPHLADMRDFAERSGFRAFYAANRPLYDEQVAALRSMLDARDMLAWLRAQFPNVDAYDSVNIVFSPLVNQSQSVQTFESNGFRELQPHVNFAYPRDTDSQWSPAALALRQGSILFTEMNHGFINPTAEASYVPQIEDAIQNRAWWTAPESPGSHYWDDVPFFNEMMNWGLSSLYRWDRAPPAERDRLIESNVANMIENRGFLRFREFNDFLVRLYAERPAGTTVADLYPQIIQWFAEQDARSRAN